MSNDLWAKMHGGATHFPGSIRSVRGGWFRAGDESGATLWSRRSRAPPCFSLARVRPVDQFGRLAPRGAGPRLSTRVQNISGRLNAYSGPDGRGWILGRRAVT